MASPIESVSDTAYWVAHYRAVEGLRARPLFDDPLAGVLAGEHGRKIAAAMLIKRLMGVLRSSLIWVYRVYVSVKHYAGPHA